MLGMSAGGPVAWALHETAAAIPAGATAVRCGAIIEAPFCGG